MAATSSENQKLRSNVDNVGSAAREIDPNLPAPPNGLSDAEISFLRLVAKNSAYTIDPKSFSMLNGAFAAHPLSPLSIATISTSLLFTGPHVLGKTLRDGASHFKPISRSSDRYSLFALNDVLSVDNMKSFLMEAILQTGQSLLAFENKVTERRALEDPKRLIVVNEFGFPFPLELPERHAFLNELEDRMGDDIAMRNFWQSCYIVFGSYHCHSEMKNSTVISLPYSPRILSEKTEDATDFAKLQIGFGNQKPGGRYNFTQDKFSPAESIGERLVPRAKIDWKFYDTDMGRVGVLICFDALDPRMLLRLVLLQLNDTNGDINRFAAIVVPCFSPNDKVAESCRLISSVLRTLVVYVNVQYVKISKTTLERPTMDTPRTTGHAYYYCGEEITPTSTTDGITSGDIEKSSPHDPDKNLWYSTRFCHINRKMLHEKSLHKSPFSPAFAEIFKDTRSDEVEAHIEAGQD